tara:strand:- start:3729 stop:4361 length:633 start_codon:yes stop_codon:yes gene_type:complete
MFEDHPIFLESIKYIRAKLLPNNLNPIENSVLERLIHTSGDFDIQGGLKFSANACENAIHAINCGAPILTDTDMAAIAIKSIAKYSPKNKVFSAKKWIDEGQIFNITKTSFGISQAWLEISHKYLGNRSPIVVFGSSPTALEKLLDLLEDNNNKPNLIVGMPVGFIGVEKSKQRLLDSQLPHIVLESTKGGAAMAAATVNALLRESLKKE